ncbi:MAG: hypothetical protein ACOX81_02040 [Candidatus Heteroscillospira sp.]|jgi:hypothetical protein
MIIATIYTVILLVMLVAIPFLEWRLAKCEHPLPGLVLPGIGLLYSLVALLSYAVYDGQPLGSIIVDMLLIFLMSNIPTLILLAIFFGVRGKKRRKSAVDKMNIQDL